MSFKGFNVIVGRLQIRAMRQVPSGTVPARQSEADTYHVYCRNHDGSSQLQHTEADFDSAFTYCAGRQRPTRH
ncbi:hypothetical protein LMG23992_04207 [Cupriavidus laharis]|uniref:Uncharacterized protein n=1 Tax=Cupriavidus laharis TaxID=151654 RepID=A0ABM8XJE7_9BURK|nr:hypothetical protein [Cupriavidus laharis]CAG9180303.1 hypothetical protein LMG23992_04207 [Cupriavidus laharis]